ncbi:MAG TPA: Y-family DNA polymerase [Chlamydiales bacterium]|nr:Y-family DNA polymerase [Chlamydiales bacterium]
MFALIDCDNFFASCESAFDPKIKKKPLVVLSNNNSCVIARSNEAKKLGIPMGAPLFKFQDIVKNHKVITKAANFALYGDLSQRIFSILNDSPYDLEVYSIDEAFLFIQEPFTEKDLNILKTLRKKIYNWTSIPVSIGIGKTKTLAKLACEQAKDSSDKIIYISSEEQIEKLLKKTPIEEIWGIGRKTAKKLQAQNIFSAYSFIKEDPIKIKKILGISGVKTQLELRETPSFLKDTDSPSRKSILSSKSFEDTHSSFDFLKKELSKHINLATKKLRKMNQKASFFSIFITTSRFDQNKYFNQAAYTLPVATDYPPTLISIAEKLLETVYKPGYRYKKCGILLADFSDADTETLDFFSSPKNSAKEKKAIKAFDAINKKYHKNSIFFLAEGKSEKNSKLKKQRNSFENLLKVSSTLKRDS